MDLIQVFKTQLPEAEKAIQDFSDFGLILKSKTDLFLQSMKDIGPITDKNKRDLLNTELKVLKKTISTHSEKRKDVTRIIDGIKQKYIDQENADIAEPLMISKNAETILINFDKQEELKRLEEIKAKQAALVESENANKEKEKTIEIFNHVLNTGSQLIASSILANTENHLAIVEGKYNSFLGWAERNKEKISEYEFRDKFVNLVNEFQATIQTIKTNIEAVKNASAEQLKQIEKQNADRQKQIEIEAAQRLKEEAIRQAEEEEQKFEEQQNLMKEIDELKKKRSTFLNLGFELIVEDIDAVPDEFVKKELKLKEAKSFIKNGGKIPGLKIQLKDGTILDEKEFVILHKK